MYISAGSYHSVGLTQSGKVVATGKNDNGQCDISEWENIICVSAGSDYTIGMNKDEEILIAGNNEWISL